MIARRAIRFEELVLFDEERRSESVRVVAGVDEAGRGALAGPVVAAAVICEPCEDLRRVRDSKLLCAKERERLYDVIVSSCVSSGVGIVGPAEIDRVNILRASLRAMAEAVGALAVAPALVLVDGPQLPALEFPMEAVTHGDRLSFSIAAASILAKVTRDRIMTAEAKRYRGYGFGRNKGYGTAEHLAAIEKRGLSALHRRSFRIRTEV
jgi:ribonuclease HII